MTHKTEENKLLAKIIPSRIVKKTTDLEANLAILLSLDLNWTIDFKNISETIH